MTDAPALTIPPRSPLGLASSILVGGVASAVSVVGVLQLPGGAGSIDEALPGTETLDRLNSDIVPLV